MAVYFGCKIGLLGGIGPEATAEFYRKLVSELQKTGKIRNNADFPQIIINSIPAPELIGKSISDSDLESYISGLKELENFGVDFIAMVCNTIHLFHARLQSQINVPIIDLRLELKNFLFSQKIKSALIIGTPSTIKEGLYTFDGIKNFEPNEREILQLSEAIFNFNRGFEKEKQSFIAAEICKKYLEKGAETVVLGCTEFAVMLASEDFPKINTIDVLSEAVIKRFLKKKQG